MTNIPEKSNTSKLDGTSLRKITRSLSLEMKQDQKHKLVQRSQPFSPLSLMYTNPAAGSIRHKCYDPGTPSARTTVQFSFSRHVTMILPSNVLFPFQIKQEDSTSEKKVPRDIIIIIIIISVDIYIHYVYIHTPNHRDTRTFVEKTPCFSHKVTHIRTLSPGAYIYTIVFCCVCLSFFFFLIQKKKNSNVDM